MALDVHQSAIEWAPLEALALALQRSLDAVAQAAIDHPRLTPEPTLLNDDMTPPPPACSAVVALSQSVASTWLSQPQLRLWTEAACEGALAAAFAPLDSTSDAALAASPTHAELALSAPSGLHVALASRDLVATHPVGSIVAHWLELHRRDADAPKTPSARVHISVHAFHDEWGRGLDVPTAPGPLDSSASDSHPRDLRPSWALSPFAGYDRVTDRIVAASDAFFAYSATGLRGARIPRAREQNPCRPAPPGRSLPSSRWTL